MRFFLSLGTLVFLLVTGFALIVSAVFTPFLPRKTADALVGTSRSRRLLPA